MLIHQVHTKTKRLDITGMIQKERTVGIRQPSSVLQKENWPSVAGSRETKSVLIAFAVRCSYGTPACRFHQPHPITNRVGPPDPRIIPHLSMIAYHHR